MPDFHRRNESCNKKHCCGHTDIQANVDSGALLHGTVVECCGLHCLNVHISPCIKEKTKLLYIIEINPMTF